MSADDLAPSPSRVRPRSGGVRDAPPGGAVDGHHRDPDPVGPITRISNGIVGLHKQYLGRGPTAVRTHLVGDLVVVVLAGGYSAGEQTLAREGHEDVVLEQRRAFQLVMADRFKTLVRDATRREIVAMLSANHMNPDLAVETFILGEHIDDGPGPPAPPVA